MPLVEFSAPDIGAYAVGNTGIPFITTIDSGKPGPHVMVNALTHGNEICGAVALDRLFRDGIKPARGRVTLGFANVAAYQRFDPANPSASRFVDEDFNRVWDAAVLDGPRQSVELERGRAIRPIIDTVDLLLDIHSMQQATAPLMLAGTTEKSVSLARSVGAPATIVRDRGHAAGRRMRDYGAFDDPNSPKAALLVECGQHWMKRSADVAIDVAFRFLAVSGTLSEERSKEVLARRMPVQRVVSVTDAVTIGSEQFDFVEKFAGLEVIPRAGTVIARDGEREIRTPYDDCVLIMPSRQLRRGQTAVRLGRYTG